MRDVTGADGGEGVFSRMHHEMETVVRQGEMKKLNQSGTNNMSHDDKLT